MSLFKELKTEIPNGSTVIFKEIPGNLTSEIINFNPTKSTMYDNHNVDRLSKKKKKTYEVRIMR